MDERTRAALMTGGLIDMTTIGRRSHVPRRIEIALHVMGGRLYVSGIPSRRKRAWLWNLEADPRLTIHLKGAVRADVAATARVITDEAERRRVLSTIARGWNRDLETMVAFSPLIEVTVEDRADNRAA